MTFENGKLEKLVLYPLRLDMHTGFPALASKEEAQIIYMYLCERNKQFGTVLQPEGNVFSVLLK